MIKVLLVDNYLLNSKVIEQDTSHYLEDHHIKYEFFEATNPDEALKILNDYEINIVYLDISSEKFDGILLLKDIMALKKDLEIVAVTVLYDKKYRYKALKLGVYKYIYKPYDYIEIEHSLEKFFVTHNNLVDKEESSKDEDDSFDFDFDEPQEKKDEDDSFDFDFDEEEASNTDIEHDEKIMDAYNKSHKKVSSEEFLESYSDVGYDTEELIELEEDLDALISSILFDEDVEEKLPDIIYILEKYNRFLYLFSEFEELCKVLYALVEILNEADLSSLKNKKMATKLIIAIIEDLVDWKNHVFIEQDAVDVFYINASILNSFILLKDILK